MKRFFEKLKRVRFSYVKSFWKLPVAALSAPFYRLFHKNLWLVCEDANEARDNGYWFFKYVRENHPSQPCVYAIKRTSPDYEKVSSLGKTVEHGSLMHWIMYLASDKKISSQKSGNPNPAVFYFLEVYGLLKSKRVFIGHGITVNSVTWLHYNSTRMPRFICGAAPEYDYVCQNFGYPEGAVQYAGLCRFDGLHDLNTDKKLVLIMPTWREWIADEDSRLLKYEGTTDIPKTNYFVKWNAFLSDGRLCELSEKYGVKFIFFPHRNMQKYMEYFQKGTDYLEVADAGKYDVQELMKRAALMITDYSSVFFDILYMKKPLIFYQFDYDMFRKGQYAEGYFDYKNNPFAQSFDTPQGVFDELEKYIKNGFTVSDGYLAAHREYFPLYDSENCRRNYEITKEL